MLVQLGLRCQTFVRSVRTCSVGFNYLSGAVGLAQFTVVAPVRGRSSDGIAGQDGRLGLKELGVDNLLHRMLLALDKTQSTVIALGD